MCVRQAQAQECILEKSMSDNRKSTITTKIAAQIVVYYSNTCQFLETKEASSLLGARKTKAVNLSTTSN